MMDEQKEINSVVVEKTTCTSKSTIVLNEDGNADDDMEALMLALQFDAFVRPQLFD